MQDLKVAIVEDQRQTREGLTTLLASAPGFHIAGSYASMEEALAKMRPEPPDVMLLDIGLPGMSGIEGVRRLKALHPELQILMLTVFGDDDHIFEAICGGATGYLLKDTPPGKLLDSIRELERGGAPMSPEVARRVVTTFQKVAPQPDDNHRLSARELDVLKLLAAGHSYKTTARQLSLSIDTVRFHIRNIYDKLHVHSKSEAVVKALRGGLLV